MTGKNAVLHGRLWRTGLDWTAPAKSLSVADVRREAGLRHADCVFLSGPRRRRQAGFGSASDGRAPSLAAALCRALSVEKGALLCLCLKDSLGKPFWWTAAILRGAAAPGAGDSVFAEKAQAEAAVQRLAALAGGKEAFSLRFASDDPARSEALLKRLLVKQGFLRRFAWRGMSVASLRPPLQILLEGAAVCAVCGFFLPPALNGLGSLLGELNGTQAERAQELARQVRERPETVFPPLWAGLPETIKAGQACADRLYAAPRELSGWVFRKGSCRTQAGSGGEAKLTVQAAYARTPASSYTELPRDAAVSEKSPSEMTRKASLRMDPGPGGEAWKTFLPKKDATSRFLELLQRAKARGAVRFKEPVKQMAEDGSSVSCPWAAGSWNVSGVSGDSLPEVLEALAALPGFFLRDMNVQGGLWTARGDAYAR